MTITLREAEHWPERNSNVPEWLAAGKQIADRGFDVIFVRDNFKIDEPLPGVGTFPAAARHLNSRADLYAMAACNMFVGNGPAWFALALDVPVLMLSLAFLEGAQKWPENERGLAAALV